MLLFDSKSTKPNQNTLEVIFNKFYMEKKNIWIIDYLNSLPFLPAEE